MADAIELVIDARATIAESPSWIPAENALYWVDIKRPALYRYAEASGAVSTWPLPDDVGAFALIESPQAAGCAGAALVALREGLAILDFASGGLTRLGRAPFDPALFRFNEGMCDRHGRFWVGVMFDPRDRNAPVQASSLHSYTREGGMRAEPDVADLHNGMAWSATDDAFYLSHSNTGAIYRFDYDPVAGRIGARHVFARIDSEIGIPDGAALDAEGHYWCAVHGGARLHRYAPDGTLDREVMLPVSKPTMCAFGGADLATLYVTSAAEGLDDAQRIREPHAGGVFRFRPGVAGQPRNCFVR